MKNKGFTLVEVIVAMALTVIIIFGAYTLLDNGNKVVNKTISEYEIQSSIRNASQIISQSIKNSTAIFVIPQKSFIASKLSDNWSYIGVEEKTENGKVYSQIVYYKHKLNAAGHDKTVLSESADSIVFDLELKKKEAHDINKLIEFNLKGYDGLDKTIVRENVTGEIEALNSLQIIDWSTEINKGKAIAFREDFRPDKFEANVIMILDCSGSMAYDMGGKMGQPINERRSYFLRIAATTLVDNFSNNPGINMAVNRFENISKEIMDYKNVSTNKSEFLDLFDVSKYTFDSGLGNDKLFPVGGTNTGDGLRMSYAKAKSRNDYFVSKDKKSANYVILLVDGDTNMRVLSSHDTPYYGFEAVRPSKIDSVMGLYGFRSKYSNEHHDYTDYELQAVYKEASQMDDEGEEDVYGTFYGQEEIYSEYQNYFGRLFKDNLNAKQYIIALSKDIKNMTALISLNEVMGGNSDTLFSVTQEGQLEKAFEDISNSIINDLWHINGPGL